MKKSHRKTKSWGAMTPLELAKATREFDRPLPESRFRPMTAEERARWERAKRAGIRGREILDGLRLSPKLISEAEEYARRKKISFHRLVEMGIREVLRSKRAS